MTYNIIGILHHPYFLKGEGLIAAIILVMSALLTEKAVSTLLYLFYRVEKVQNALLFVGHFITGNIGEIQKSYRIMGRLTTNLSLTDLYCFNITAKNQNSVIHFENNHIKLFYSYFANFKH